MIRKATLKDAPAIQKLINDFAKSGLMLARPISEIYENIRDYYVALDKGRLVGVAGLRPNWDDLAEIKSVAVKKTHQKKGLGRKLIDACLHEGYQIGVERFYTLTYVPKFFQKIGFKEISKDILPHKVWSECVKCPKFPDCDEVPLMLESKGKDMSEETTGNEKHRPQSEHARKRRRSRDKIAGVIIKKS